MCDCRVNEEADDKKKQELRELFVPGLIKFLFNRLPRIAIFSEFQKFYEQNQDHLIYSVGKQEMFCFYVLLTRLPFTHQRQIELKTVRSNCYIALTN